MFLDSSILECSDSGCVYTEMIFGLLTIYTHG